MVYTTSQGALSDGSGASNYANDANCAWLIAPPGGVSITLSVTEASTEYDYDFIKVFQCQTVSCGRTVLLAKMSGTYSSTQTVTSNAGFMLMKFSSDNSVSKSGFSATWTSTQVTFPFLHLTLLTYLE
jgi:hypothetical protein